MGTNPSKWKAQPNHNPISKWLEEEGYTKKDVRQQLSIQGENIKKFMMRPGRYMSIEKIMILNDMLENRSLQEIFDTIMDGWLRGSSRRDGVRLRVHDNYIEECIKIKERGGRDWYEL